MRHHVPRGWGPQGNCKEGRSQVEWGGAARGRGRERRGHEAGRGQRGVGGASAIQPVQAAAGGSACRVPSTLGSESVTGTTGSDQRQTRGRAEAGGTESGGRSPSSKGGKYTRDRGSPGSSAASPPLPKGPRRRSRGAAPERATQAGIPNRRPRLLLHSGRLTCGQRCAASARIDGTCVARLTGLRPSTAGARPGRRTWTRGCGSQGSWGAASLPPPGEGAGGAGAAAWNPAPAAAAAAAVVPVAAGSRGPGCPRPRPARSRRRQPGTMNSSSANITYASRKRRKPVQKT